MRFGHSFRETPALFLQCLDVIEGRIVERTLDDASGGCRISLADCNVFNALAGVRVGDRGRELGERIRNA